jgi:hypothetical protein
MDMVRIDDKKRHTLKVLSLCVAAAFGASLSPCASAEMIPLTSDELSAVQAEGTGMSLSLDVAINGTFAGGNFTPDPACADVAGTGSDFCRFGFQGGNGAYTWLLFKQMSGYYSIPKLVLYGTTVSPVTGLQSALALEMTLPSPSDKSSQVSIRDLSYNLAVAATPCDTLILGSPGSACGTTPAALDNQNAYYDSSVFQGSSRSAAYYSPIDAGKETGALGLRMNGNLNIGGTIIVFSQ